MWEVRGEGGSKGVREKTMFSNLALDVKTRTQTVILN